MCAGHGAPQLVCVLKTAQGQRTTLGIGLDVICICALVRSHA